MLFGNSPACFLQQFDIAGTQFLQAFLQDAGVQAQRGSHPLDAALATGQALP